MDNEECAAVSMTSRELHQTPPNWVLPGPRQRSSLVFVRSALSDRAIAMPIDRPEKAQAELPAPDQPFSPSRERERIVASFHDRILDARQADVVCTTLTLLAEMEEPTTPVRPEALR